MGQKSNYASGRGARSLLRTEECALDMGQKSNDAAVKDAPIKLRREECAGGMVQMVTKNRYPVGNHVLISGMPELIPAVALVLPRTIKSAALVKLKSRG